ncbi:MAG: hypothetical protein QOJ12_22 [Thermoleophilales bacterium]|nr:hypothetical protein [Thermoleophilales bacterium]
MNRGTLGSNILASAINVLVVVGTSLVAVPLLIDRLGIDGYGLWTLAQTVIIYVTTAELGVGPALARFTSVHRDHPERPRQVMVAALILYTLAGLAVVAACHLLARPLVDLFPVPARLRDDSIATVGIVGWVSLVALLAGALGHMLAGLERFGAFTWTNVVGAATFLVALILLTRDGGRIQDAAYATLAQWGVVALVRLVVIRDIALGRGTRLPGRALLRELLGFSARLQLGVLASLVNTQTDRVVIGAVAIPATLGRASIATQVADAGRMLAYAAFNPMASRMAVTYGANGQPALDALLARQRRLWTTALLGGIAVAIGAVRPAIEGWLGTGYDQAALFAAFLIAGYGIGLIPGPLFAYLRAKGNPTLEGLFGLVTVAVNLCATIVLALLFGAPGVVAGTLAAYTASTIWVLRRSRSVVPPAEHEPARLARLLPALVVATAAAYGVGEGLLAIAPRAVALAALCAAAPAIYVAYLAATTGIDPIDVIRRRATAQAARD